MDKRLLLLLSLEYINYVYTGHPVRMFLNDCVVGMHIFQLKWFILLLGDVTELVLTCSSVY